MAARRAHNPEVEGSNPSPATTMVRPSDEERGRLVLDGRPRPGRPRIRRRWTCSDFVYHEHRTKLGAWLCGKWQYWKFIVLGKLK